MAAYTVCVIATPVAQNTNFLSPTSFTNMATNWIDLINKAFLDLITTGRQTTTSVMSSISSGRPIAVPIVDHSATAMRNVTTILADLGKGMIETMNQRPNTTNSDDPVDNTNNSTKPST